MHVNYRIIVLCEKKESKSEVKNTYIMPFNSAQKVQIRFVRYAAVNNKHFVIDDSCKRKQAEHILKKLQDFPAMGLWRKQ